MDGFSDAGKIIRGVRDKSFTVSAEDGFNIDDFSDQIGISKDDLFKLNPGLEGKLIDGVTIPKTTYVNLDLAQGSLLGFDPEKISQINQKAVADAFIGPPAPEGSAFVNPRLEAAQVTDPTIPGYVEEAFQSETRQFPTTVDATTGLSIDATKQEMTKPFQAEDAMKTKTRTNVEIPPEGGSAIVRPIRENTFSARFQRATRGLRPGEVGLVESVKNWQNVVSPFMGSPEDVSFQRPGDIIDVSSNIAQYTPEPIPNFMQSMMGGNMFGSPALMEQLQYYGLYRPDTMSRTA